MAFDSRRVLDYARWSGIHWNVLASTSLGFLVWGFVYSTSTIITSWPIVPKEQVPLLLTISPIFLVAGNFTLGVLADRIGRKNSFFITLSIYTVGLVGIVISGNFLTLLLSIAIAQFGVGGEEPPALAALAELTPVKRRGTALVLSSNFYNIGALAAAVVGLYGFTSIELQRALIAAASLILFLTILLTRRGMPESVRWLVERNRLREAEDILNRLRQDDSVEESPVLAPSGYSAGFAFTILVLLGISQLTTYGLLAFIIGPYHFPSLTPQIILAANAGASVAGFLAASMIDRMKRRIFTLISYIGGLITVIAVLPMIGFIGANIQIFYLLLFLNMIFSEYAWACRVTLEPELANRTNLRSTFVGLIRLVAWGFYIISVYVTSSLSVTDFVTLNVILWGVGALAAIAWFMRGTETGRRALEAITGEVGA